MDTKLFAIYDETGFTTADIIFLESMGQGTKERGENLELYLSIEPGAHGDFPVLTFLTDESRLVFFRKIQTSGLVYTFSTMPRHLLERFDDVPFRAAGLRVRCLLAGDVEGQTATTGRWIRFVREASDSVSAVTEAATRLMDLASPKRSKLYKAYFNSIAFDIPSERLIDFYRNLFEDRVRLPICLPPSGTTEGRSYWGNYTLDGKRDVSLKAIRKVFWDKVLSYDDCDENCLFVQLLKMTDQPVFTEYIKDGAFFSLSSFSRETKRKDVMDAGGTPAIAFCYSDETISEDFLREWRLSLLRPGKPEQVIMKEIREAVTDDLVSQIPGSHALLQPTNHSLPVSWDTIDTGAFNNRKARGEDGPWTTIRKIRDGYNHTDVADFIDEYILNPSEAQGSMAHDHDLALQLFSRYLCKFPFAHLPTYSDAKGFKELGDFEIEWQHFLLDFIRAKGSIPLDKTILIANGKCTYNAPLTPQQIFGLRLMMPASMSVESSFTSILDYPNALDFNFIL